MTNEKLKQCLMDNSAVVLTTADGDKLHGRLQAIRYVGKDGKIYISVEIIDKRGCLIVGDPERLEKDEQ